jgi:amidophosphoribosyltransferase
LLRFSKQERTPHVTIKTDLSNQKEELQKTWPKGVIMCGIMGVWGPGTNVVPAVFAGLYQLQHRGQESAGMAVTDGEDIDCRLGEGLVLKVLNQNTLQSMKGFAGIGHTRYSTSGKRKHQSMNGQPILIESRYGPLAVAHNGNLTNELSLKKMLLENGTIFKTNSDTEIILHLIQRSNEPELIRAITTALREVRGAYSLVFLTKDEIIVARDPNGFRPLILGEDDKGTLFVVSETVALDINHATYLREISPGEILTISRQGMKSVHPFCKQRLSQCSFEHVYFSRPDSNIFRQDVNTTRKLMGCILAEEDARLRNIKADIVVPVPDSGMFAAKGYADKSGLPFEMGLIRNHYIGRSFIEPDQEQRKASVRAKLNPVKNILAGARVILIDDSIVRGTTTRKIVSMVKSAGAKEVHVRITSPPIIGSCHYGVDTPRTEDLIAAQKSVAEICAYIKADSLAYLTLEGLQKSLSDNENFCYSCFTNKYPVEEDSPQLLQIDRRRQSAKAS